MKDNKCSDCTNDKGCINCEDGNMYEKMSSAFENFAKEYMEENDANIISFYDRYAGLVDGVRWQKENLWKPADGDDLPEIDREVIVLYQRYPLEGNEYAVGFAHRPKEFWDGKNIATGEVTRYYPKRYDKGGWNSPDIKWWLDLELPV